MARKLDEVLFVWMEKVDMPPTDPNDASGEEQESFCPVEDMKLLSAGVKYLLVAGVSELLEPA